MPSYDERKLRSRSPGSDAVREMVKLLIADGMDLEDAMEVALSELELPGEISSRL